MLCCLVQFVLDCYQFTWSKTNADIYFDSSAPEVQKVSQPDNEQGALENRDPNKRHAGK